MEKKKNIAASIRAKLKNKAQEKPVEFQNLLVRFGNERLLYRLSQSVYQNSFLLKGAALFAIWTGEPHRPTKDMDLLGFGKNDIPTLENIFREICAIDGEDGLEFMIESIKGAEIRADKSYQGVRITLRAFLDGARIPLQIDIGFGDAVTPTAQTEIIETILDLPQPKLKIYPKETVIAEKFEAMVKLGIGNSRMKDFWDVKYLIRNFSFDGVILQKAIKATFDNRKTSVPTTFPVALTDVFTENNEVKADWEAFIKRNKITSDTNFELLIESLRQFFGPIIEAEAKETVFEGNWTSPADWER
ncbi:MAG TPA: nucleotidyl transferase AbiEii/AbiGii toxin family protein [Pyrinomonadaceae bacterium]|nr:nucleotidyl transferase AbiEii/AbiGii toxin family protein [Pyrinomonadaceae bacterium]